MEHSLKEKLRAIKLCKQGLPIYHVAKKLKCSKNVVTMWVEQYKLYGAAGLQRLPQNCRYNNTEKCQIVCEVEEKGVPLHAVCAKYRISRSSLSRWLSIVRVSGYDALHDVEYGRKYGRKYTLQEPIISIKKHAPMGRPKKKEPMTELEKLQRENELLRAENAFLKKARALMKERECLAAKTKPKSSNH